MSRQQLSPWLGKLTTPYVSSLNNWIRQRGQGAGELEEGSTVCRWCAEHSGRWSLECAGLWYGHTHQHHHHHHLQYPTIAIRLSLICSTRTSAQLGVLLSSDPFTTLLPAQRAYERRFGQQICVLCFAKFFETTPVMKKHRDK